MSFLNAKTYSVGMADEGTLQFRLTQDGIARVRLLACPAVMLQDGTGLASLNGWPPLRTERFFHVWVTDTTRNQAATARDPDRAIHVRDADPTACKSRYGFGETIAAPTPPSRHRDRLFNRRRLGKMPGECLDDVRIIFARLA